MNRMTEKTENGYYVPAERGSLSVCIGTYMEDAKDQRYSGNIVDRLGAYEDCGLEPEEACKMAREWTQYETAMSYVDEIGGLETLKEICVQKKTNEKNGDYIQRSAAENAIRALCPSLSTPDGSGERDELVLAAQEMCADAADAVHRLPAADVVPVRYAKWDVDEFGHFCTACKEYGKEIDGDDESAEKIDYRTPYCPNCGAIMEEG